MSSLKHCYSTLSIHKPDLHIVSITLNRPKSLNALNTQMGHDLISIFEQFQLEDKDIRCIILTGAGEKAFCAGGDLKERNNMTDKQWCDQHAVFERAIRALIGCPVPIIAAVNGIAYGGGCELAAACSFIYASSNARFALPEVGLGIMPGAGGTQNLPRAMGTRRALEVILTGQSFTAHEAANWGLVNNVVEPDHVYQTALNTANIIAENAPISVRQAKQAICRGMQMSLWDGLMFEIEAYNRTLKTQDRQEGLLAFHEGRKPKFTGN